MDELRGLVDPVKDEGWPPVVPASAVRARAETRRRRRAYVGGVALVAAVGALAWVPLSGLGGPDGADGSTSTAVGGGAGGDGLSYGAQGRVSALGVSMDLPQGWRLGPVTADASGRESVCLEPPAGSGGDACPFTLVLDEDGAAGTERGLVPFVADQQCAQSDPALVSRAPARMGGQPASRYDIRCQEGDAGVQVYAPLESPAAALVTGPGAPPAIAEELARSMVPSGGFDVPVPDRPATVETVPPPRSD